MNPEAAIVADKTFILATRETGYRDVSSAVAELVDNSLQAGARTIRVFVREDHDTTREVTIGVLDDGRGMAGDTLRDALRFGGSERFDDRTGLGRFGMGLPNSSVSQTRRVDVFTWQRPNDYLHTYLDVDEVAAGCMVAIPDPTPREPPEWAATEGMDTGTLVLWSRCDRLTRQRAATIAHRLAVRIGRLYRYAIWSGVQMHVNDTAVTAFDPLFLRGDVATPGGAPYGPLLTYEFHSALGRSSTVEVQFSELPIAEWHIWSDEAKRRAGIIGNSGVSIVRAGREIDYGWHLMGAKRREHYDDWWRCEIRFSPELDELFGVTHSKQGITPSSDLRSTLSPDLERIARVLNARTRSAFDRLRDSAPSAAVSRATLNDRFLPPLRAPERAQGTAGFKYRIEARPLPGREFYQALLDRDGVVVTLNQDHPFFTHLYEPALANISGRERHQLECLILAAARAELDIASNRNDDWCLRMRQAWGDALAVFLDC
jgi:hypothetical protein